MTIPLVVAVIAILAMAEQASPQAHQKELPVPGNYSGTSCPTEIHGCLKNQSAVVIEQLVPQGVRVSVPNPPCEQDVSAELIKGARALADAKTKGSASTYAGPAIDEATKQLAGALASLNLGGTGGDIVRSMTGSKATCSVLCIVLPARAWVQGEPVFWAGDGDR